MLVVGIIGWVLVGLVVGFIVSKVLDLHGDDPRLGVGVAGVGAIIFAVAYTVISGAGVSAFNIWSLLFAAIGAIVAVVVWHLIRSKYVSRAVHAPEFVLSEAQSIR